MCLPPSERKGIVAELGTDQGIVLWNLLRDMILWQGLNSEERSVAFPPSKQETEAGAWEGSIPGRIRQIATLLASNPREEDLAHALAELSADFLSAQAPQSAAVVAELAAWFAPGDARWALRAARAHGLLAQIADAVRCYRSALWITRQQRDWYAYSMLYMELASFYVEFDRLEEARSCYRRALRGAKRQPPGLRYQGFRR